MEKPVEQINKKLTDHRGTYASKEVPIYEKKGRPKKEGPPIRIEYQIEERLLRDEVAIELARFSKVRFILATN